MKKSSPIVSSAGLIRLVMVIIAAIVLVGLGAQGPAQDLATVSQPAPGLSSIRQEDLRADLFFFASDALRGRLINTQENLIASEFLRYRFEQMGLAPAAPGYFQNYNLVTTTLGQGNALQIMENGAARPPLEHGRDYYAQRFSATVHARGPVVFAGFGITAPDLGYDDYRASDRIRGAIVLVIDHEPGERDPNSPFNGVVRSEQAAPIHKARAAQAKGAAGILFVSDVHNHPEGGVMRNPWAAQSLRAGGYSIEAWMAGVRIPAMMVSVDLAGQLVKGAGKTLADLAKSSETERGIEAVPLQGVEVDMTAAVNRQLVPDRNVIAKIEGTDPQLRDECVIISGHIDHDGANGAQIFNGADDNGSGAVGVLAIAKAYSDAAKAGHRPRRTVLFAEFNSEERGMLGSHAYTEAPLMPLDKTIAVLNMDMIGRDEEVPPQGGPRFNGLDVQTAESNRNAMNVIGTVRTPDLRREIDRVNKMIGLEIRYRYDNNASQLLARSDHWPFIQHGIPGLWFFTGLHPDYHQTGDRPEKINYDKMERILKLLYQVSWDVANSKGRPALLPRRAKRQD